MGKQRESAFHAIEMVRAAKLLSVLAAIFVMNVGAQLGEEDVVVMLAEGEQMDPVNTNIATPGSVGVSSIDDTVKQEATQIQDDTKKQTDAIMAAATNSEADAKKQVEEIVANSNNQIEGLEKKAEEQKKANDEE